MKIVILGLGYVGCTAAGCIASQGHRVVGVDPNSGKVDALNAGNSPVHEPGLGDLIAAAPEPLRITIPMAAGIGLLFNNTLRATRFREYIGHNAEILTARRLGTTYPGFDYQDDAHNAKRVWKGYQGGSHPTFKGLTPEQVGQGLARWKWLARIIAALLHFRIMRHA